MDELFDLTNFVGVSRPGYDPVDLTAFPAGAVTLVDIPALAISSPSGVTATPRTGPGCPANGRSGGTRRSRAI